MLMTRARAFVAAVPQRVWAAVAGLALLASLAIAAVIGAGLSVWRNAVGTTAEPPLAAIEPPGSGLVVLPGGHVLRVPSGQRPARGAPPAPTVPILTLGPLTSVPLTPPVVPASISTGGTSTGFTPQLLPGAGGVFRPLVTDIETPEASGPANHGQARSQTTHVRNEARATHRHAATRHRPQHAQSKHARSKHHAKHAEGRDRD